MNNKILNMVIEIFLQNARDNQVTSWLGEIALKYGYFGAFLISFLGSLSIIFPVPYTMVIFVLGGWLEPNFLAISAGIGSALGEILGYLVGYYMGSFIGEERRKKMEPIMGIFKRYGAVAVFIFALTPLPDDLLLIPLGIMRLPFIKVFLPCILGKVTMCFILAYGGRFSIGVIRELMGGEEGGFLTIIATGILLIAIIMAVLKVDWEKLLLERS